MLSLVPSLVTAATASLFASFVTSAWLTALAVRVFWPYKRLEE
jgi:hypothetical protein